MPQRINGRPTDGIRKLNLRYRVDDPRYCAIEQMRLRLEPRQGTGVLLAALALGAEMMFARMPALPSDGGPASGVEGQDAKPQAHGRQRAGRESKAVPGALASAQPSIAPETQSNDAAVAVRFSEGTRRQFEQFGEIN